MRISAWSSDVCSSDLLLRLAKPRLAVALQHDPPLIRGDGFIQRNLTALQVRHDRLEFAEGLLEAHPLRCRLPVAVLHTDLSPASAADEGTPSRNPQTRDLQT